MSTPYIIKQLICKLSGHKPGLWIRTSYPYPYCERCGVQLTAPKTPNLESKRDKEGEEE